MEKVIKFLDGRYIIRPSGIGDTIIGGQANKAMTAMNKRYGYTTVVPMEEKIKFITNFKKSLKLIC